MKIRFRHVSQTFQIKKSLWKGVLIAFPLGIIAYIIFTFLNILNSAGESILGLFVNDRFIHPGMGLLLILFLIYLLGRVEIHFENREKNIWQFIKEKTVGRIPLFGSFFTRKKRKVLTWNDLKNSSPCKFYLSDTTPHYGFIIGEQPIQGGEPELDIYRPNVPTLFPGDLFPVKKRLVIKLGNSPNEIADKLASGGMIKPEEEIPVPWENETEEEFKERVNLTPLEIAIKRILEKTYHK